MSTHNYITQKYYNMIPYFGTTQASPKECQRSLSFDVKQLPRSSIASLVSRGDTTFAAKFGP